MCCRLGIQTQEQNLLRVVFRYHSGIGDVVGSIGENGADDDGDNPALEPHQAATEVLGAPKCITSLGGNCPHLFRKRILKIY